MSMMPFEIEDRDPVPSDFPKLSVRPDAYFEFEGRDRYHVGRIMSSINAAPNEFQFGVIDFAQIAPQLRGHGNIDMKHVDAMMPEDARRPIIMVTEADGRIRIVDGYHRATRSLKDGERYVGVWVLNRAQTFKHMF